MARVFSSTALALVISALQAGAWAGADAHQWLERMSMAAHSLNYSGTFVYQHHGRLEAMQIMHAMDEEGERERLLSLTGPKREVLRDNQVVTCILGDRQSVVVNKSQPRTPFPVSFPRELKELEKHYRFNVLGEDRVAGLNWAWQGDDLLLEFALGPGSYATMLVREVLEVSAPGPAPAAGAQG